MKKLLPATINEQVAELLEKVKSTADFGYVQLDSINATNALGDNVLHCVCVWGDLAAAKLLVEHGINVNQRGEFGFTPLKIAIDFGHCEIAEYLQANGANPSSVDAPETFDPERNALHMQRLGEQIEFLVQQLAKGCTIETQPIEPSSGASGASRFT